MEARELKAILAHELAHVLRSDVTLYLATATVAGTCYALFLPMVFRLWEGGALLSGTVAAALLGALCFGAVPGWVSRRAEYGADALATSLMDGDGRGLASALASLARLKGDSPSQESLTHPSVASRIRALGLDPI
jgi:Zn-dependent protease with chaperone function